MSVRVRVKVGDPGAHEKKRGQEGRASFKIGQKRNRAAVYRCGICNLREAPREGICEADMEATLRGGVGWGGDNIHTEDSLHGSGGHLVRGS